MEFRGVRPGAVSCACECQNLMGDCDARRLSILTGVVVGITSWTSTLTATLNILRNSARQDYGGCRIES
jgi:hypothetical protein